MGKVKEGKCKQCGTEVYWSGSVGNCPKCDYGIILVKGVDY